MSFTTVVLRVVPDGTGVGKAFASDLAPGRVVGVGVRVLDVTLGGSSAITVLTNMSGATNVAKTIWAKTVGATSVPIQNVGEVFLKNDATATTTYWFPVHDGFFEVDLTGASGASALGFEVIIVIEV